MAAEPYLRLFRPGPYDSRRPAAPAGYTAWFIAYFAVAIGATWLLSAPRYLAAMPTVPLALSLCAKTRKLDILLTSLCLALSLLYALAFVLRWQVW